MTYSIQRIYQYTGQKPAIFIDRLWPRGIRKEVMTDISWMKDIAPSTELRKWFHADKTQRYAEFCQRYQLELSTPEQLKHLNDIRQLQQENGTLILLTAAKEPEHSHVPVLIQALNQL
ncbi:hypothetical protein F975_00509 [Acinetobacter sp. ANC 3789]|uniref:DUF488 domain-containing protein n=1 Tax=Acinetobacter sp. ANC 3789 TaxID=1217714 RepID=UPI0002CF77C9|nr:DUF488 family protein [Acinetobacter sp. ANC 3789]ENU81893.1 hypothetical protein F975_00509 [Acinetobacter sp. ANC 3789]